ncbi:MAG: BspA family leucine-rich repeat surface protein [Eubacteriaceae bacterium]|nr:BspA family leucine-rich repeat surface protein [Eubacteriaceae bacterium]
MKTKSKVLLSLIVLMAMMIFSAPAMAQNAEGNGTANATDNQAIAYRTHVENVGWQPYMTNGTIAGTSGFGYRLEAMNINLQNQKYTGDIEYRTHIENIGWENEWKKNDAMSGTSNRGLRLEAMQVRLTGEMAEKYDVYYRVHAQNIGWLGWAKNGEESGTAGYGYRLEAMQIMLVDKGGAAPTIAPTSATDKSFVEKFKDNVKTDSLVAYQNHVQNVGWQNYAVDGGVAGTSGLGYRLEGMKIFLNNPKYKGDIEYRTHIENIGWENEWKKNNAMSGTSGLGYRLEAMQIRLTGEMAEKYDVYYRVHAQNIGWLGWAKNGEESGTAGYGYRLEAMQIVLVDKGGKAPNISPASNDNRAFIDKNAQPVQPVEPDKPTSDRAVLDTGKNVNTAIKQLSGQDVRQDIEAYYSANNTIKAILRSKSPAPSSMTTKNLSTTSMSVTAWWDANSQTIYWYSEDSNPMLNEDSSHMFARLLVVENIDLSYFDTSKVTNMCGMFSGDIMSVNRLANLDVSHFDTSQVTNMNAMFADCGLTDLDLSNFDTSKVTNMSQMFYGCSSLINLDLSNFDTSKVTNMGSMFSGCNSLTSLNMTNFNTSNVTGMSNMFAYCKNMTALDVSNFDTSKVTEMANMFSDCNKLKTIYVSDKFTTQSVNSNWWMFSGCYSLIGGNGTPYDDNHRDKEYARIDKPGQPGYFTQK